jgi:hypothetical protein
MTYYRSPGRNIDLHKVLPFVPRKRCSEEARTLIHVPVTAKVLAISAQDDPIRALLLDADAVICETVGRVEVEDPEKAGPFEHDDFVALVL